MRLLFSTSAAVIVLAVLVCGCQSPGSGSSNPEPAAIANSGGGVSYHKDKDLQKVWVKDGADLAAFDTILVPEVKFQGQERQNEVEMRTWATGYLREAIARELKAAAFGTVALQESELSPGRIPLRLELSIIEYEKGGGGARYFAGIYGAGQPVLRVLGKGLDGTGVILQFEARRSGDSGGSRMFGGFKSDKDVQREDIDDLAKDLTAYIARIRGDGRSKVAR